MRATPYLAEFIGTFVLVLGGCGSAILAGQSIGFLGVAFAFGLSLLAMAYAVGHLSGCHINPAVSLGVTLAGRLTWREFPGYVLVQVLGAVAASWLLYFVATSHAGPDPVAAGFAANGYGAHSPGGYDLGGSFVLETALTFVLVFTVLATTNPQAPVQFAGLAIGLVLTLIHLVGIPVTNTSVNPARSTGPPRWSAAGRSSSSGCSGSRRSSAPPSRRSSTGRSSVRRPSAWPLASATRS